MTRPNLLIIHTDQQDSWSISAYGGTLVSTPNIDRLATDGARFTNFFTNSAICTPSRGCFVTGRYPHAHGAYRNNLCLHADEVTFAEMLRRDGYDTGYIGKWHLDGDPRPGWVHPERCMGFADNYYMFNRGHWKKIEDAGMGDMQPVVYPYKVVGDKQTYTTDYLTGKALDFVGRSCGNPFCLMLSLPDPHGPVDVRPPYDTMFSPDDMPLPDTMFEEHVPDWARPAQRYGPKIELPREEQEANLRRFMAKYCGEVKLIDDCVGRLIDALETQGVLDDTIVVFTTDHGEYMGEHGLMEKNNLYETAYHIPFVMRWPGKVPAGTVAEHFFTTVDFQPTILGLMDVAACGREQGRDYSPVLTGKQQEWTDESYIHHHTHKRAGIFTPEYELAYVKNADAVLFDRVNDPQQTTNLFGDAGHADTVTQLTQKVVAHHRQVASPACEWLEDL